MSASIFSLFIIVSAFNGVSWWSIATLVLFWLWITKKSHIYFIGLTCIFLSYLCMAHFIQLNTSVKGCARVVSHYEQGGLLELYHQRFSVFEIIDSEVTMLCGTFLIKHSTTFHRFSLDPLTRYQRAMRIQGSATIKKIDVSRVNPLNTMKRKIKDILLPEKEDDTFWMIHHSGIWMTSFLSIFSSLLHLKLKRKTVHLWAHGVILFFSWLTWDVRTVRLLIVSCFKLLQVPHPFANYLGLIISLVLFPYSVVSAAFLFPCLFYD